MEIIMVLCTVPDQACAERLAQAVLEARLAACISCISPMVSWYYWQGVLQRQTELQLLLKSDSSRQVKLFNLLKENHPYQVPELIAWPIANVERAYAAWVAENLAQPSG
ncbi:MAG: divalent-cation tolerance protein CutA [Candidatus Symbiodolus clandestinus]